MIQADVDELRAFYRTLSTEQLLAQRAEYAKLEASARRRPRRALRPAEYFAARRALMAEVLGERGVEALN